MEETSVIDKLHCKIAELERELANEREWRRDAELMIEKLLSFR